MLTAHHNSNIHHPNLDNIIDQIWPGYFSHFTRLALSRILDLWLCYPPQQKIYHKIKHDTGEISPVNRFRNKPNCVEYIFLNPILNPIQFLGYNLVILNTGLCNFCLKTYSEKPQTRKVVRVSDTVQTFTLNILK